MSTKGWKIKCQRFRFLQKERERKKFPSEVWALGTIKCKVKFHKGIGQDEIIFENIL